MLISVTSEKSSTKNSMISGAVRTVPSPLSSLKEEIDLDQLDSDQEDFQQQHELLGGRMETAPDIIGDRMETDPDFFGDCPNCFDTQKDLEAYHEDNVRL